MAPSGLRPVGVQAEGSFWPEARTPQEDVGLERSLKRGRVWSGGVKSGTVVSWEEAEELVRGDSAFPHRGVCRLHLGQPRSCPPGQASAKVSAMGRRADTGTGGIRLPPGLGHRPAVPRPRLEKLPTRPLLTPGPHSAFTPSLSQGGGHFLLKQTPVTSNPGRRPF